jgi:capsular polysaccharide biosynthesis protein
MLAATEGWQRLLILAPAIVIGAGLIAAVLILLIRAFLDSTRDMKREHKRVLWIAALAVVGAVVLLTYFGVELPKE